MSQLKKQIKIKKRRAAQKATGKKVDLLRFCGILKLKEDPLVIQKRLRNEWQ